MAVAVRYPLDYDSLDKGTIIPKETLKQIFDVHWDKSEFGLRSMALGKNIVEELRLRNRFVIYKTHNHDLLILEDEDAHITQGKRFKARFKGMKRAHRQALTIDSSKFDPDLKKRHVDMLTKQAAMIIGASIAVDKKLPEGTVYISTQPKAFKAPEPTAVPETKAHKRNTPRAFEKPKTDAATGASGSAQDQTKSKYKRIEPTGDSSKTA